MPIAIISLLHRKNPSPQANIVGNKNVIAGRDMFFQQPSEKKSGTIKIEDISAQDFPTSLLDFRVSNPGTAPASISRVLLKVVKLIEFPSPVGKQEPSTKVEITLDKDTKEGSVLAAPIALTLQPGEQDRFVVSIGWKGKRPDIGKYFYVVPAIKTSAGYVAGNVMSFMIQENFSQTSGSNPEHQSVPSSPTQFERLSTDIDWKAEDDALRVLEIHSTED